MTRDENSRRGILDAFYFALLVIGGPLGLLWVWIVIFPSVYVTLAEAAPHYAFSVYWSFSFFWNWRKALKIGPGHPPKWPELDDVDDGAGGDGTRTDRSVIRNDGNWCPVCLCKKPPRSHHCQKCDVCVLRRDHHCGYLGTCIGFSNQRHFVVGLFHFVVGGLHVLPPGLRHLLALLRHRRQLTWCLPVKLVLFHVAVLFGYIDAWTVFNVHLTAFGCMALVVAVFVLSRQAWLVCAGLTGYELDRLRRGVAATADDGNRAQATGSSWLANLKDVFGPTVLVPFVWPFYSYERTWTSTESRLLADELVDSKRAR